jgi:pSer/pThr/pTyr-binding forkhead associated (FHA) protein
MALFAQLSITEAGRPDRTIAVTDTVTIGRDARNDIVLAGETVSHWHAMLLCDAAGLLLIDLESTNGTVVNGVLALPDEPVRLADGDVIRFGQVVARYAAPQPAIAVMAERPAVQREQPRFTLMETPTTRRLSLEWALATTRR